MSVAITAIGTDTFADGTRRHRKVRLPLIGICFFVVAGVLFMAILGPLIVPQNPATLNFSAVNAGPSAAHWLGTDSLGRDIFSRLIVGSRTAFFGPLIIAGSSFLLGNLLGLLVGYRGGKVDAAIMRWVDLMWSIPSLLVLIVIAGAVGGGYWLAVGLLVILTVPFDTRIVRGATLEQVPRPYVESAKTLGVPNWRIMFRHIWPNVSPVAVANTFLVFASSIVALAGLSFLGLGVSVSTPDWGLMLSQNEALLFTDPAATLAPGALLVILATSMNLIGDWIYERLSSRGVTR